MQKFDLHMHTTYCDGNDSAEDMILAAIDKGLDTVGISGHSFTPHDPGYCMSRAGTEQYISEVLALKGKYRDKIRVLLGLEMDYYAETDPAPYDYLIGSLHYLFTEAGLSRRAALLAECGAGGWERVDADFLSREECFDWADVDYKPEFVEQFAKVNGFDMMTVAEQYFATVGDVIRRTDCDIVGHFDLLTKFNERSPIYDTTDPRYVAAWQQAADRIFEDCKARYEAGYVNRLERLGLLQAGDKPVFEINVGAISRGYRTTPYPAQDQLEYIKSKGGILILSSDSHSTQNVAFRFEDFEGLL